MASQASRAVPVRSDKAPLFRLIPESKGLAAGDVGTLGVVGGGALELSARTVEVLRQKNERLSANTNTRVGRMVMLFLLSAR